MRIFGSIFVLASLAVGAYLFVGSAKQDSPASTRVQTVEQQAVSAADSVNLQAAATQLEGFRASSGTYEGATIAGIDGVTLVRADSSSYCLQTASEHETGPGGSPAPGPC